MAIVFELCSKTFTRKDNLVRHVKSLHTECERFHCQKCGSKIKRKDKFLAHMRSCSKCAICDLAFENTAACVSHKAMVHGIRKRKK